MGKNANKSTESQNQKTKREGHQTDRVCHHPDHLAAALAVTSANNSRITLQSLLNRCKHWHRQRERETLSIVLNSLSAGMSLSSSSLF